MARLISLTIVLVLLSGCQAARNPGTPDYLSDRLASIEHQRLNPYEPGAPVEDPPWRATAHEYKPDAQAKAPFARSVAGQESSAPSLSLSEFGDAYAYGEDDAAETVDLSGSASRSDTYERRGPLPSFWETVKRDVKEMPSDLWRDTKRVYGNPVNLVILGTTLGGAITLKETGVDRSIEHHFNRRHDFRPPHHHFKEDWRDAFGAIGNPGTHFALAGAWYLLGQQTMDGKTYEVGKTLFSALMINGLTVMVGQAASYDRAPNGERGTLPSGHTSSSFVVASVMHQAYGHLVGIPLYGLATLAGYERVEDGEHYFSDVVMGGVLGLVVGHSVASGRDPEFFGWKVVPWASPDGGAGVAFAKSLD